MFIPGWFVGEGAPIFSERQKYVVFLTPLKADAGDFKGTVVYRRGGDSIGGPPFEPKSYRTVVGDAYAAVRVAPENDKVINRIRSAVGRAPRG